MFRPASARPLLLLVDDDPFQDEVASYIAFELGCDFESAPSGNEALEKVSRRPPDVVLLDVRMPDLSGYEVCRRIKTDPQTSGTQVLFVTARNDEEGLLAGFESLANDYLTKPFSARELKARVKNALRTKALHDALTDRNRLLELQQEITERIEAGDESRLPGVLDRIAAVFGAEGASLHLRALDRPDTRVELSTVWPSGAAPGYLAALALSEDPSVERAPRLPGETRDPGDDWAVLSAPLWAGEELIGTLRLHRRGALPAPGESAELEHLLGVGGHLARTIWRSEALQRLSTGA